MERYTMESHAKNMKILWLSNKALSEGGGNTTGAWLDAMAQRLVRSNQVELGNISTGPISKIARRDLGPIKQWIVPFSSRLTRDGLPSRSIVHEMVEVVKEFSPDVIHVWGTEQYWGLLTSRKVIDGAALLETQGLKFVWAKVFSGGLSIKEQIACVGLKEILRRSTIFQGKKRFEKWGSFEKEIISRHRYIAVQTKWGESQVRAINSQCMIFESARALRAPFYKGAPWQFSGRPIIFCSAAYPSPFKGLHIAVRSVAILKKVFPNIRLRIAGAHQRSGIRRDGYITWLVRETKRLGIYPNVEWLGPLDASEIIDALQSASVVLIPTYIENCCNAMQEAMMVGTPVVTSYTGGLPSLAKDEESALFFPVGDEAMCAYQLGRVLTDPTLAVRLSTKGRKTAIERNDPEKIVMHQLKIYGQIIADSHP